MKSLTNTDDADDADAPIDYFSKERRALRLIGISFDENVSIVYERSFITIFVFTIVLYSILDTIEATKHDFEVVGSFMVYLTAMPIGLGKGIAAFTNRKRIGAIMRRLGRKPCTADFKRGGDVERELLDECEWITSWQFKIYAGFATASVGSSFTVAIINLIFNNSARVFTYGPLSFLDLNSSYNYLILTFYQHCSIIMLAIAFVFSDLLMAASLAHVSYQFKMVQNNFKCVIKNSYHDMMMTEVGQIYNTDIDNTKIKWKYLKKHLERAVSYHRDIIDMAQELEVILNKLLLFVFLGTLSILCFLIFRASVITNQMLLIRAFMEIVSAVVQVLVICYWGEEIVFHSQEVGQGIYESDFVGTDIRFQKAVLLILRRSQNPAKLTAGNFKVISLATFTWILKTSYSAFMIVNRN